MDFTEKVFAVFMAFLVLAGSWAAYSALQRHTPEKPVVYLQTNNYTYSCADDVCDVYLTSGIEDENKYLDLYNLLVKAKEGQEIKLHLSGSGGYMTTVYHLANTMLQSKAKVTTIVEGPVYSAHAFIAMLGTNMIVMPNSHFLFHIPAIMLEDDKGRAVLYPQYCMQARGQYDRGQDAEQKCLDGNKGRQAIFDRIFKSHIAQFLTPDEQTRVYQGYDVYVDGVEMQNRLKAKK